MLVINMTWLKHALAPQKHINSQKYDSNNFKLTLKNFGFSAEREKKKFKNGRYWLISLITLIAHITLITLNMYTRGVYNAK